MAQGDSPTVHVELLRRNLAQRFVASEVFSRERIRPRALQYRQRLRSERFINLDQVCVTNAQAALGLSSRYRENRAETHA